LSELGADGWAVFAAALAAARRVRGPAHDETGSANIDAITAIGTSAVAINDHARVFFARRETDNIASILFFGRDGVFWTR
jgi:hypothetical protein